MSLDLLKQVTDSGKAVVVEFHELEVYFRDKEGEVVSSLDDRFPTPVVGVVLGDYAVIADFTAVNQLALMDRSEPPIDETINVDKNDVTVCFAGGASKIPGYTPLGVRVGKVLFTFQPRPGSEFEREVKFTG